MDRRISQEIAVSSASRSNRTHCARISLCCYHTANEVVFAYKPPQRKAHSTAVGAGRRQHKRHNHRGPSRPCIAFLHPVILCVFSLLIYLFVLVLCGIQIGRVRFNKTCLGEKRLSEEIHLKKTLDKRSKTFPLSVKNLISKCDDKRFPPNSFSFHINSFIRANPCRLRLVVRMQFAARR